MSKKPVISSANISVWYSVRSSVWRSIPNGGSVWSFIFHSIYDFIFESVYSPVFSRVFDDTHEEIR